MSGIENKSYDDENTTNYSSQSTFDIAEPGNKFFSELENPSTPTKLDRSFMKMKMFRNRHRQFISRTKIFFLNAVIVGYFAWATYHFIESRKKHYEELDLRQINETEVKPCGIKYCGMQWCDGYGMLIILLTIIYVGWIYYQIKRLMGKQIGANLVSTQKRINHIFNCRATKILLMVVAAAAFAVFLAFDTINSRRRLQSLTGIGVLLSIGFIFSASPTKIKLRPIVCGFTCQLLLGLFCIRWEVGRNIFKCIGDKVALFLVYTSSGSTFVYGNLLTNVEHVFAFGVLPVIFFVSFIISILYYLEVMQWIVLKLGWVLQTLIGTTICESITCAANVFLGMSESPLLIKPYIKYLTKSEIHVVMASGFATVSGSVLAAYVSYGADPAHLVTASVMAAPAALCFAKLFYPETEESKTNAKNIQLEKSTDTSILDAASNGANTAIALVMGIIANIVAFVAFVAFLNSAVSWFGIIVGYEGISFEWFLGKLFVPLAWIIGIEWDDCEKVATIIASKTIINEFVAYERLGKMKLAEEISLRSAAIATYAICGFANPGSLGIAIGSLSAMCPEKRPEITSVAVRAFISGSVICFITASIAGLLMTTDNFEVPVNLNNTLY